MEGTRKLFLNKDGRLRTTLQIAIACAILMVFLMIGQMYAGTFIFKLTEAGILPASILDSYFWSGLFPEALINFTAGGVLLLSYKLINRKKLATMGVSSIVTGLKYILLGIGAVAIMQACIMGILLAIGDIRFTGFQFTPSFLQYFLLMSSVSFAEEVLNRGYIQHLVKNRSTVLLSCLIPSIIFMMYHLQNPGITNLGLLNIFLVGFCFSLATQKFGNIWFAFGAHLMWNAGSACVFGLMSVSTTTGSILNFEYQKETIFNGFAQSPLYGLIGTLTWGLVALFFIFKIRKALQNPFVRK